MADSQLEKLSVQRLSVMVLAAFLRNKPNGLEVMKGALEALREKSQSAYDRVYDRIVALSDRETEGLDS